MLELRHVTKIFKTGSGAKRTAVSSASLRLSPGETVGLLGESGCGKTTLAMVAMKLTRPDSGQVLLDGDDITGLGERAFRKSRGKVQMVFQNPISSFDPLRTNRWSLREAYDFFGRRPDLDEMAACFGLPADILDRRPAMVSGGEAQRVAIMRSLASDPEYLILDEPTSMLDLSIQASIMELLASIGKEAGWGTLLITHDVDLAACVCDRLYIMREGRIVESGKAKELLASPESLAARMMTEFAMP